MHYNCSTFQAKSYGLLGWGGGQPYLPPVIMCLLHMLTWDACWSYNSCFGDVENMGGVGDTGIVLVFTALQSAQPLFQLSAMLIRTINHIFCACLLSTNMGISGPWHHLQLSRSFVVNCGVFRLILLVYCKVSPFQSSWDTQLFLSWCVFCKTFAVIYSAEIMMMNSRS